MRSRLEAGFAAWLDKMHLTWQYEPQAFAGPDGQYLPDFLVPDLPCIHARNGTVRAYFETKPHAPEDFTTLARRMAIIWDSEPNAYLLLAWPDFSYPGTAEIGEGWAAPAVVRFFSERGGITGVPTLLLMGLSDGGGSVAIGHPLLLSQQPWAGEYWNVQ